LRQRGREAVALTRGTATGDGERRWDPSAPDPALFEGAEAVVHLAGATIATRWNAAARRAIHDSRVDGTRRLVAALALSRRPPPVLVCASAVGIYGDRGDEVLEESSLPGAGFLAGLVRDWEAAAAGAGAAGIRVVRLRQGLVLSSRGGALAAMLPAFRLGLGGAPGDGRQWWSWISIDDAVAVAERAIDDAALAGAINAVAPHSVTAREFARTLGRLLGRPSAFGPPAALLRLAFGEMADEVLLASQRVRPARLLERHFPFSHPRLEDALRHALASGPAAS
jgi:uncharacterized protein (TIGR01777 family)